MIKKLTVGLFFGGMSTEHEVSVVSAIQAFKHFDRSRYEVVPIYLDKTGHFFSNPKFLDIKNYKNINSLLLSSTQLVPANKGGQGGYLQQGFFNKFKPIDVAFPLFHGSFGEDGAVQGLFEMYQVPYTGFGVTGSAIAMDKVSAKAVFQQLGLPFGKFYQVKRFEWNKNPDKVIKQVLEKVRFPLFVKPSTGGSSIGAGKATDADALSFAIEVAAVYSDKILIEEAFENCIEVNCSALGFEEEVEASVCEQPVASGDVLSFRDKYLRGGGKGSKGAGGMETLTRIIPAPVSKKLTREIQEATVKVFQALDGCGVARIDYFVDPVKEKFWINEVNSPPGSLAYYLWEKSGLTYTKLIDKLIGYALKRAQSREKTQYIFESGLLGQMARAVSSKS